MLLSTTCSRPDGAWKLQAAMRGVVPTVPESRRVADRRRPSGAPRVLRKRMRAGCVGWLTRVRIRIRKVCGEVVRRE